MDTAGDTPVRQILVKRCPRASDPQRPAAASLAIAQTQEAPALPATRPSGQTGNKPAVVPSEKDFAAYLFAFFKDNDHSLHFALSRGGIRQAVSDRIDGGYVFDPTKVDPEQVICEAPSVWKRTGTDVYVMKTTNFTSPKHEAIIPLTLAEAEALAKQWGCEF